ncbi:hypothetical protein CEN50_00345 [Fischerella thermalis CCMEE 5268]|uniref:Uncharacterized protein n=1 Tax=Fischerella thermalis CCMEE 5268 TaxID=2019662 RepID=A0A2N6KML0_9CYAN|nr:hypothetical protein CEN50_00345 [Fischerella thermalis CCMEE 5268]
MFKISSSQLEVSYFILGISRFKPEFSCFNLEISCFKLGISRFKPELSDSKLGISHFKHDRPNIENHQQAIAPLHLPPKQ